MSDTTTPAAAHPVLDVPMDPADNDAGASSVRDYLCKLLTAVWSEGEGFSGKRPFGNSNWENELYLALAKADVIACEVDNWGEAEVDEREADRLILAAINDMAAGR